MKKITIKSFGKEEEVFFTKTTYANNGNTAIQMWCENEDGFAEPYATFTVNLMKWKERNMVNVDTNNLYSNVVEVLEEMGLIENANFDIPSGFCLYPTYILSDDFLDKWCE